LSVWKFDVLIVEKDEVEPTRAVVAGRAFVEAV
jgi:hypothetical protein